MFLVFAVAMLSLFGLLWAISRARSETTLQCMDVPTREHIKLLTADALDAALKDHVKGLFSVWMKDHSDQPRRAMQGMDVGINAYRRAQASAKNWNPTICAEVK